MIIKKLERKLNDDLENTIPFVKNIVKQIFPDIFSTAPPTVQADIPSEVACDYCHKPMKEISPGTFVCHCR